MVTTEDIDYLTNFIAESFLSAAVEHCPPCEGLYHDQRALFARVRISGTWSGSVTIGFSETLARIAAGAVFHLTPEAVSSADVVDLVGEFANILGGNVKSLLTGHSYLSLPTVSAKATPDSLAMGEPMERWFRCCGEPLVVLVRLAQHAAA